MRHHLHFNADAYWVTHDNWPENDCFYCARFQSHFGAIRCHILQVKRKIYLHCLLRLRLQQQNSTCYIARVHDIF
jgi:hypothetical protein